MAYLLKVMFKKPLSSALSYNLTEFSRRTLTQDPSRIIFSDEVKDAKITSKPIVALESTIITHGMPYPVNLETAVQVENIIRERGAIPATIAILKGQITVGLTKDQLQYLAETKDVVKTSRRDFAPVLAGKLDGATTVAGTIIAAELADIPVFVTGGLGGVHREGETTWDVSADLNELGRSKTLVVCSGVKSILDIGRTLEYLETQGVCVCAFGDSKDFPAFYTTKSGFEAPYRVSNAEEAARILHAIHAYQLSSGTVIAVPIPNEYALNETMIETAITNALEEAKRKGIRGKELTPFILSAVSKATGGSSLNANIALVKNNAKVGADIAIEFRKLKKIDSFGNSFNIGFGRAAEINSTSSRRHFHSSSNMREWERGTTGWGSVLCAPADPNADVLVIGGANVDRTYRVSEDQVQMDGSTHACIAEQCGGGVARNLAEALWRLREGRVKLITAIGADADGEFLSNIAPGLILDGCVMSVGRTPTYAAVLDHRGDCLMGLGDMKLHNEITPQLVDRHKELLDQAPLVVLDGNLPQSTIDHVMEQCHRLRKPVFFEPTDRRKATKIIQCKQSVFCSTPNITELRAMARYIEPNLTVNINNPISEIIQLAQIVSIYIENLVITMGAKGIITVRKYTDTNENSYTIQKRLYYVDVLDNVTSVSGAGDCFASGFIHGLLSGHNEARSISIGFEAAKSTLQCKASVPHNLRVTQIPTEAKYKNI